jgi:hypothetical protein
MRRVGILSMQRIFNYGSFLQAYGLKKILEELDCDVEFVDYHPGKCLIEPDGGTGLARKLSKVLEVFQYPVSFLDKLRYIRYKKNYAKKCYPYLGIDNTMNYTPQLDVLIIGSDEVFNCVQNNTNVGFSPELFGAGNHADKLISYAASFGNTTIEKLEQYGVKEDVAQWLKKFESLSVRDMNSGNIVRELTGKEPQYHIDPVLAYDFLGKCKEIPEEIPETDYMILYGYSGRFSKEECSTIRVYADKNKLKIFCIGGVQNCCDRFIDCSPFQVLAYFQRAECVVTDTFHGTIMSVITHRQFVSVVRSSGYGNSEKMTDLLERLELTERMISKKEELEKLLDTVVDYTNADKTIAQYRKGAYTYLKENLE